MFVTLDKYKLKSVFTCNEVFFMSYFLLITEYDYQILLANTYFFTSLFLLYFGDWEKV